MLCYKNTYLDSIQFIFERGWFHWRHRSLFGGKASVFVAGVLMKSLRGCEQNLGPQINTAILGTELAQRFVAEVDHTTFLCPGSVQG
jgi:hypothetical protein